jgi:hypothetical protein
MNIDKLIEDLTDKLDNNNHYRGRNRRRDHVLFFFTDNHENILNIRIDHDDLIKEDFSKLEKYL